MITIEVYAPPICNFDRIDKQGNMLIDEGTTLKEVLKIIKLPLLWRKFALVRVNSDKVSRDYIMKEADVLSIFMPVTGG